MLEEKIRAKYELAQSRRRRCARKGSRRKVKVHVIGFAKLIGELIDGLLKVMVFFAVAALDRHRHHLRVHALRAQHRAGDRVLARRGRVAARAWSRCSASSSTRSRSWCRSWCSRSACRTARRR